MHPDSKNLGLAVNAGTDSAHANNMTVQLRDQEVTTRLQKTAGHISEIGKVARLRLCR